MDNSFYENIPLVKHIARRFKGQLPDDDIYQAGLMGLYSAVKAFDKKLGYQFSTFAAKHIIGSIKKEIRDYNLMRLPKNIIRIISHINKLDSFRLEEVMRDLNCTKDEVISAMTYRFIANFDETRFSGERFFFDDLILGLKDYEKNIMILRFKYNLTELDIAFLINKSQSYVSKIIKRILAQIKCENDFI